MYIYDSSRFEEYRDRWISAADSSILRLASHPSSRPDLTFLSMFNGKTRIFESQHRKMVSVQTLVEDDILIPS